MQLKRILFAIIGWTLLASLALATVDRTAPTSTISGGLTAVMTDVNEELAFIYQRLPQPLESISGTNDYTASIAGIGNLTAYADGNKFRIKIPNANTSTTVNLNIDGLGNIGVFDKAGSAIPVGGLATNSIYVVEYIGGSDNHFRVLSPLTSTGTAGHNFCVAAGDETTTLTTGAGKVTFNLPQAMSVASVYAYVRTASSSGLITVDINEDADAEGAGSSTSILSTKLTIDQGERRSTTAATAAVISDAAIAAHSEMTIDIDGAGATANGLKVCFVGTFS